MICVNREIVALLTSCCDQVEFEQRHQPRGKVLRHITTKLRPDIGDLIMFDCGERGTLTATFVGPPDDDCDASSDARWILNHEDGETYSLSYFLFLRETGEDLVRRRKRFLPVIKMKTAEIQLMNGHQLNRFIRENVKRV